MKLLERKLLWIAVLGVVLSGAALLAVIGYVGLVAYSALVTGTPIVELLLDIAVPFLVAVVVLVGLLAASGIGVLWALAARASRFRSDRAARIAEYLEREYPPLRVLGLSDLIAPPEPSAEERAERALADLKRQYVEGSITEAEFERKVDRLIETESIDEARAVRERDRVVESESEEP